MIRQPAQRKDLTGQTSGMLTVIDYAVTNGSGHAMWNCKCSCGGTRVVSSSAIIRGDATHCGCVVAKRRARSGRGSWGFNSHSRSRPPERIEDLGGWGFGE